jgi:hypothetical protein
MTWDRTIEPSQEDLIRAHIEHALHQVHTAMPCRVQSYDPVLQVADLVPLVRCAVHDPDGGITHEDYPVLPCVPVVFPRTADHFIAFAIQPGDMGVALFCEDAIGHWRAGGGDVTDPGFLGRHHLGAGVFIPGLFDRSRKLANAPAYVADTGAPRLVIGSDDTAGTRVTFNNGGSLKITQGSTVVFQLDADGTTHIGGAAASQFVALANLVDSRLSTIRTWLNTHTHPTAATGPVSAPSTPLSALDSVAATKAKAT